MRCPNCTEEKEVYPEFEDKKFVGCEAKRFVGWLCKDCDALVSSNYEDNPNAPTLSKEKITGIEE